MSEKERAEHDVYERAEWKRAIRNIDPTDK